MSARKDLGGAKRTLLSAREKELWHAFKKMGDTAFALVAGEIEAGSGLSGADFGVLSRLEDLGKGTLAQSELAASLGWHRSRLSHQLTRMEDRNLLRRKGAASGRGIVVEILPKGGKAIAAARPIHAAAVRKHVLRHIGAGEARAILKVAARIASRGQVR